MRSNRVRLMMMTIAATAGAAGLLPSSPQAANLLTTVAVIERTENDFAFSAPVSMSGTALTNGFRQQYLTVGREYTIQVSGTVAYDTTRLVDGASAARSDAECTLWDDRLTGSQWKAHRWDSITGDDRYDLKVLANGAVQELEWIPVSPFGPASYRGEAACSSTSTYRAVWTATSANPTFFIHDESPNNASGSLAVRVFRDEMPLDEPLAITSTIELKCADNNTCSNLLVEAHYNLPNGVPTTRTASGTSAPRQKVTIVVPPEDIARPQFSYYLTVSVDQSPTLPAGSSPAESAPASPAINISSRYPPSGLYKVPVTFGIDASLTPSVVTRPPRTLTITSSSRVPLPSASQTPGKVIAEDRGGAAIALTAGTSAGGWTSWTGTISVANGLADGKYSVKVCAVAANTSDNCSAAQSKASAGEAGVLLSQIETLNYEVGEIAKPRIDVQHSPVVLIQPGSSTNLLFTVICPVANPANKACSPTGTLFYKTETASSYSSVALSPVQSGRPYLVGEIPAAASLGTRVSYYAVITNGANGSSAVVPAGGAAAPHRAWIIAAPTAVPLGAPLATIPRTPTQTVATFGWGSGANELGLAPGDESATVGPSGFDLAGSDIVVLDQLNQRLVRFPKSAPAAKTYQPIAFDGGSGDIATTASNVYVIDNGGPNDSDGLLRSFDSLGAPLTVAPLAESSLESVVVDAGGRPRVRTYPGQMYLAPLSSTGFPVQLSQQLGTATESIDVGNGEAIASVVRYGRDEVRIALTQGAAVTKSWTLTVDSSARFGSLQLVRRTQTGLVAVVSVFDDTSSRFVVVKLPLAGVPSSFTVEPADYAQTAPLSLFRLGTDGLYQLRSVPAGVDIVRHDLGAL